MRLEFSRWVESDLTAIADYIAQDNPARAVSFIREIREKIHLIAQHPLLYQLRPEIGEEHGWRSWAAIFSYFAS